MALGSGLPPAPGGMRPGFSTLGARALLPYELRAKESTEHTTPQGGALETKPGAGQEQRVPGHSGRPCPHRPARPAGGQSLRTRATPGTSLSLSFLPVGPDAQEKVLGGWVWWHTHVFSATQEAEVGGLKAQGPLGQLRVKCSAPWGKNKAGGGAWVRSVVEYPLV